MREGLINRRCSALNKTKGEEKLASTSVCNLTVGLCVKCRTFENILITFLGFRLGPHIKSR